MPSRRLGSKSVRVKAWSSHDSRLHHCPKCYQRTLISRMHFIFNTQAHFLRSTPCRCFSFLALSSFQVRCAVPTSCVITFQSTQSHHASHAITTCSLSCHPRSLRVWILIAWLFCIHMSPHRNAFCILPPLVQSCSLVCEWNQPLSSSDMFCSPSVDMLLRQALPLPSTYPPSPEAHTASHTRHNRDDYLCVSPI